MAPQQAKFFKEQFGGKFVMKTFINNNVDNTFMFLSGDVCIYVEENNSTINMTLGKKEPNSHKNGKVRSKTKQIDYVKPSKYVGEINEFKRKLYEEKLGGSSDLYQAWVNAFGEDSIIKDNR